MINYFVSIFFKRTYKYLLLTFFSILVGSFLFGTILSISQNISNYFVSEGKVLIGGDIALSSNTKINTDDEIFATLHSQGHTLTQQYSFDTVWSSASNTNTSVGAVRAVDPQHFPLYGDVITDPGVFLLQVGSIYAEQTFLNKLNIDVGDTVTINKLNLKVLGVLIKEPDGVSTGLSFNPKIIMTADDLAASGIDLSQSRTRYKVLIKQNELSPLTTQDIADIESYARSNKIRFDDASDGPRSLVRNLSAVEDFVGIVVAIALFLVVINIFANLTYLISKFRKTISLLKTFGAETRQIQTVYFIILGIIGISAGAVGAFLGALVTTLAIPYLSDYLDVQIPTQMSWYTVLLGSFIGLSIIITSALPFFNSLRNISPKQLINNLKAHRSKRSLVYYIPIPILLIIFLRLLSSDWKLILYSVAGLVAIFALFITISYVIIRIIYNIRDRLPLAIRVSISSLRSRGLEALVVMASIMTAFSGVFIVSVIEKNIVTNINQNISDRAPALYLTDITTSQLSQAREIAGETFREYAIIRGRLLKVNDRDLTTSNNPGVTREFNMTYRDNLISGEEIVDGVWHGDNSATQSVSIDDEFADEIGGVEVGDTVEVFIQGITVQATVTSIRSSDRSSGTPFFYLVFSRDVLADFPASYFATVEASSTEISIIENKLGIIYPNIIPVRTGTIVDNINKLIATIVPIVEILGIPSIILGILLVLVMTGQSLYERRADVLVLRAMGLRRSSIISIFIIEVSSLIIFAGVISYALAHTVAHILNQFLFSFKIFTFAYTPLMIIASVILTVSFFAYTISRSIVNSPLKKLLAEK